MERPRVMRARMPLTFRFHPGDAAVVFRTILIVLVVIVCMLQRELWFGRGGKGDVAALEREMARQNAVMEELRLRNQALAAEVADLKQGSEAVEELARSELGMIRKGETFVQVYPATPPFAKGSARPESSPKTPPQKRP